MESHGVKRQTIAGPKSENAKAEERQKLKQYKSRVDRVNKALADKIYDRHTFELTAEVLSENPEYYTVWNYRRRILQSLINEEDNSPLEELSTSDLRKTLLAADLKFVLPLLVGWPKCYWIWNHRIWLLQQATKFLHPSESLKFWQDELGLVSKMLARDNRNFHGWSYRSTVIAAIENLNLLILQSQMEEPVALEVSRFEGASITESEFAYTTKMIHANLSNFSAWHRRSKLIARLLNQRLSSTEDRRRFFENELKLIWDALFDPADQSLWFYHQYLMSVIMSSEGDASLHLKLTNEERVVYLQRELAKLRELLEDVDDCKWIYQSLLTCMSQLIDLGGQEASGSRVEMLKWLSELKKLDPLRKGRWVQFGHSLGLS